MPDTNQTTPIPNVVLTGFSATGKSSVGRHIARKLGFGFVDTDFCIEDRWGPIPEIFENYSEDHFRQLERAVTAELSNLGKLVIATGGGTILDPVNVENLARSGVIICLVATPETILERVLLRPGSRPLLSGPDAADKIRDLLAERAPAYAPFVKVDTTGRELADVADEIVAIVSQLDRP